MSTFSGKVAIITGASGFMASGVIPLFREAGAHLSLSSSDDRLFDRYPDLKDNDEHICFTGIDLSNPDDVQEMIDATVDKFGQIDMLINIVGGWEAGKPVHETELETWDKMLALNARITFLMCRTVIPYMLKRNYGKIVNIGAKPALKAGGNDAAYAASKAAVLRLTESMSEEYKRQGININAILPSALNSSEKIADDPDAGVTPQQVAKVIAFLCSDDSSIIHGVTLPAFGTRF